MIKILQKSPWMLNGALVFGLLVAAVLSGMFGQVNLSVFEFVSASFGSSSEGYNLIVQELRMPRILLGIMAGATLGYTGAALQGLLRNPLADPGVVGVSSSASLGAVAAIYLGVAAQSAFAIPLFAMTGALIATLILMVLAARDSSVLTLILAGMGISSLATAGVSLMMNFAPNPMSLQDMVMWMLGSLENRTVSDLWFALPFIGFGWLMMLNVGQGLNALSVGEDTAKTMGVNIKQLKLRIVVGSAISVGAAVAVCGSIGFVGLIVPHMVRGLICQEPGRLLLPSALMGALLLTFADILTRVPTPGAPLHIGVVMALVGAPAFLFIVYKTREAMR